MNINILKMHKLIKTIKNEFEDKLTKNLNLFQILSPKFIKTNTGIQDDLAGTCSSIKFNLLNCGEVEIIHSLAKWKRLMLKKYNIEEGFGICTNMDAIRKDEILDNLHSAYVDQWDWELTINETHRNIEFLKHIVNIIYETFLDIYNSFKTENQIQLPPKIKFIHSSEIQEMYPMLSDKEREYKIAEQFKAVFIIGIKYPERAFDYDDWNLNGDIILWNDNLKSAFELSSMGIRVNRDSLIEQSKFIKNVNINTKYHKLILNNDIPLSIGGGIGMSRLCMYVLGKNHIGEVQFSEWSNEELKKNLNIL